jgi:uncharacterized protein (TIGR02246 family)
VVRALGRAMETDEMKSAGWLEEMVEAWNARDGARYSGFFADDGVYEDVSAGLQWEGRERIAEQISMEVPGFSADARVEITHAVGDETGYAFEWRWTGTSNESHRPYEIQGASVGLLREGLIVRHRDYFNFAQLLEQISAGS